MYTVIYALYILYYVFSNISLIFFFWCVFRSFHSYTMLSEFFQKFDSFIKDRRSAEHAQDFLGRECCLDADYKDNALMKHAAEIYTPNIFRMIQLEYRKIFNVKIINFVGEEFVGGNFLLYETYEVINGEKILYNVRVEVDEVFMDCSCRLFVNMGLLCRHSFAVMYLQNLYGHENFDRIPKRNILHRWTRNAKKFLDLIDVNNGGPTSNSLHKICSSFWLLASNACKDASRFQIFMKNYKDFYDRNKADLCDSVVSGIFLCLCFDF